MRSEPVKSFHRYDANISIWNRTPTGPVLNKDQDMETYEGIRMLLVRAGFTFHQDPHIKKHYRSIAAYHHCGERGDMAYTSAISGMHTELRFFEPTRANNPNGAQYDSDRLERMSYLGKQRFFLLYRKIGDLLRERAFECTDDPPAVDGLDWLRQRRAKDFSGRWAETGNREWIEGPIPAYNRTDADGRLMSEGDVRYGRDYDGHLVRGRVYYALNHMWLLVAENGACLSNHHSGAYFSWKLGLKRRYVNPKPPLERELKAAVAAQNFEKAIILRDALRKLAAADSGGACQKPEPQAHSTSNLMQAGDQ